MVHDACEIQTCINGGIISCSAGKSEEDEEERMLFISSTFHGIHSNRKCIKFQGESISHGKEEKNGESKIIFSCTCIAVQKKTTYLHKLRCFLLLIY